MNIHEYISLIIIHKNNNHNILSIHSLQIRFIIAIFMNIYKSQIRWADLYTFGWLFAARTTVTLTNLIIP